MSNILKFIVSLAVALVIMLAVRAYAFTVCSVVTDDFQPEFRMGERVIVNRLQRSHIGRGDLVVFGDSALSLSRVAACSGDTISIGGQYFEVESFCRPGCDCLSCKTYLLVSGHDSLFVSGSAIMGKAYPLYFGARRKAEHVR